jgi:hypothetical protein
MISRVAPTATECQRPIFLDARTGVRSVRTTDRELTDIALLQASRRSQELFRHAAERVHKSRAQSNGATLHQAVRARVVLHDDTKSWRDRVLEARTLVDDISDAGPPHLPHRFDGLLRRMAGARFLRI